MILLLRRSPLCVSHLQTLLDLTQVAASKQLRYLRRLGLVEKGVYRNFRIYRLRRDMPIEAKAMLDAFEKTAITLDGFRADLARLETVLGQISSIVSRSGPAEHKPETPRAEPVTEHHALPGLSTGVDGVEYVD